MRENSLKSYRDLKVWQLGMDIAVDCYKLTQTFPASERFGLSNQIQRSSSRIPANIAEGYGRRHRGEYLQFLRIACGSLNELETHLLLATEVGRAGRENVEDILAKCDEEGRMLGSLIRSLEP